MKGSIYIYIYILGECQILGGKQTGRAPVGVPELDAVQQNIHYKLMSQDGVEWEVKELKRTQAGLKPTWRCVMAAQGELAAPTIPQFATIPPFSKGLTTV